MVRLACALLLLALPAFAADTGAKPRVAALYYVNKTGSEDMGYFAKGLSALLINDLGETGRFTPLERERMDELLAEKKLGESAYADKASFGNLASILGTEYLITGEVIQLGKNKYFLISKIIRAGSSEILASSRVALDAEDVMPAVEKITELAATKLDALGSTPVAPTPRPQRTYKLPLSTTLKYARALHAKDKKDPETAKRLLTEVTTEQPDLKLAKLDLLSLTR